MTELLLTAREWAEMMAAPVRDKTYRQVTGLGPLIAEWLDYKDISGRSPATLDQYERLLARLARMYPAKDAREFEHGDLLAFIRSLPRGSRRKADVAVKQFFKWAHLIGYLRRPDGTNENPILLLPSIAKRRPQVPGVFTDDDERQLLALPDIRDSALMAVLLMTGIRDGEARRLRWRDVKVTAQPASLLVEGKGRKQRLIPLEPFLLARLGELAAIEGLDGPDHLWYSTPGRYRTVRRERSISYASFMRWWCRCLVDAGVVADPGIPRSPDWLAWEKTVRASDGYRKPHMTRHTFATKWKQSGGDSSLLADILGHESMDTVRDYYEHLELSDLAGELGRVMTVRGLR